VVPTCEFSDIQVTKEEQYEPENCGFDTGGQVVDICLIKRIARVSSIQFSENCG
jgi:hypothetical protein